MMRKKSSAQKTIRDIRRATRKSANFAYQALLFQGYRRENIYYLNPDMTIDADGDGILNDIDAIASSANLEDAILNWATDPQAPAYELVLYIVDHGGDSQFRLNETELLSATQLDAWLDELQEELPGKLVVIYDACQSGTFIPQLLPPAGKERIVMTSAGDENAFFINQDCLSFSFQFWSSIFSGGSLYDSFVFGKRMMQEFQTAQIDSNGNGIAGEKADKTLAQDLVLGRGYVPASDKPFISAVSAPQILTDTTTATISASGIIDATWISRVWGVISHPDFSLGDKDVPVLDAPEIELTDADGDNTWTGSYDQFTLAGTYTITIYALNNNGFYSASTDLQSNTTTVQQLIGSGDSDGDGIADDIDAFPSDPSESVDTDGDGIGNNADSDDDNDGVPDFNDAFPLDSTRSSHIGGISGTGEVTYTDASGEMLVPPLQAILPGEEITSYGPVTMSYSPSCEGVVFTLTGAAQADAALLADMTVTAAIFDGTTGELVIPLIEVITRDIFGTSIISIYTNVIMELAPDCPGTSLRVTAATVVE